MIVSILELVLWSGYVILKQEVPQLHDREQLHGGTIAIWFSV